MSDPKPYNPLDTANLAASIVLQMEASEPTPLSALTKFQGAGLYAIYYSGPHPAYAPVAALNRDGRWGEPIYVGKATPEGGRKGVSVTEAGTPLFKRLREHAKSIAAVDNLDIVDFYARWIVVDDIWIPLGESALLKRHRPVWNVAVDGFGNHDPGRGRINGLRTRWDTLHPGRPWAGKFPARSESAAAVQQEVMEYLRSRLD